MCVCVCVCVVSLDMSAFTTMSHDELFHAFLLSCDISPEQYRSLAPLERVQIMTAFHATQPSHPSPAAKSLATPTTSRPLAMPPLPNRTDAEAYDLLIEVMTSPPPPSRLTVHWCSVCRLSFFKVYQKRSLPRTSNA